MFSLVVIAFSAWVSVSAADLSSEFAHKAVLDPRELMKLYWTVDWDQETISFAVEAATTGWVGLGFSSGNGRMVDSDVVIGWVKDSKGYLTVSTRVYGVIKLHRTIQNVPRPLCSRKSNTQTIIYVQMSGSVIL